MRSDTFKGLLIIADDLSGAADCAAGFARHVTTAVVLGVQASMQAVTVLAVDLDSRRLSATMAGTLHRELLSHPEVGSRTLYKKIDSTLRGNVAAEVQALQAGRGMALVAPALPAMGRTTVGGVQHLHGTPVDQTDVWHNERLQGTADLVASLRAVELHCETVELAIMRDPQALTARIHAALNEGVEALVCDAQTDADLRNLARCSVPLCDRLFWVGSAGLAAHLPEALALSPAHSPTGVGRGPLLCVVGSMSSHSQHQARLLAEQGELLHLEVTADTLLDPARHDTRERQSEQLRNTLAEGRDAVVSLAQSARDPAQAVPLSQALATWLQPTLASVGTLIATGGETARALLGSADISYLEVAGELAPGIVLCHARYQQRDLNIVTKAGAFGQPDTLFRAWQQLRDPPALPATPTQLKPEEANHV